MPVGDARQAQENISLAAASAPHKQYDAIVTPLKTPPPARSDRGDAAEEDSGAAAGVVEAATTGMSQWDATLFIVGELAGAGLLALSEALTNTGVVGVLLIVLCAAAAGYTGHLLGRTWVYLESSDDRLTTTAVRQPYAEMGRRTYGTWMGRAILCLMSVTLFGTGVVLLLVSADLLRTLAAPAPLGGCGWTLLLGLLLTPVTWLGSPKHLRTPALLALASVVAAALLMLVEMLLRPPATPPRVPLAPPSLPDFCLGLSTIMFSFTGVSTFPTIQLDMRDRALFSRAAAAGFAGLCVVYVPVAAMGYTVYGATVQTNLTSNFSPGPLLTVIQVLLIVHFLGAFVMLINPVCQNLEGALHIHTESLSRGRVLARSGLMLLALLLAETVPSFGKIMHLIGGSFTLMLTFIIPSLLYIRLRGEYAGSSKHGFKRYVLKRLYLCCTMLLCVGLSIVVVYYSLHEIVAPGTFQVPCYLRGFYGNGDDGSVTSPSVTDVTAVPAHVTAINVTDDISANTTDVTVNATRLAVDVT